MSRSFGNPRIDLDVVTSTNDVARAAVREGVAHGALFTARHQTRGRGRRAATWIDQPGESALMSFVVYPDFPIADAWVLSFAAALAASEALVGLGARAAIKWPNDILVLGGKAGGVLVEAVPAIAGRWAAIIGIGINVGQRSFVQAEAYPIPPTSLRIALGERAPDTEQLIRIVAECLARRLAECDRPDRREKLLASWRAMLQTGAMQAGICAATGRRVVGILRDVRLSDGFAMLEEENGTFTIARPVETYSAPVGAEANQV